MTTKITRKEYLNNYNKTRKDDEYYALMKRLNNKLSYFLLLSFDAKISGTLVKTMLSLFFKGLQLSGKDK